MLCSTRARAPRILQPVYAVGRHIDGIEHLRLDEFTIHGGINCCDPGANIAQGRFAKFELVVRDRFDDSGFVLHTPEKEPIKNTGVANF